MCLSDKSAITPFIIRGARASELREHSSTLKTRSGQYQRGENGFPEVLLT